MAEEDLRTEKEKYQEMLKVTPDDEIFAVAFFRINKIGFEIGEVKDLFYDGTIDGYEALTKLEALLALTDDLRQEIKKRI